MKASISRVKNYLSNWFALYKGVMKFLRTNHTPGEAYQAMIALHCSSDGKETDRLHRVLTTGLGRTELSYSESIFGEGVSNEVEGYANEILENGFVILGEKLPTELVEELESFALTTPARVGDKPEVEEVFQTRVSESVAFRIDEERNIRDKTIQRLMIEPLFRGVAASYLGVDPVLCQVNLWWSTPSDLGPSREAAQEYHFDMSRAKWINVFVYLTDVGSQNGPHWVVRGSHRSDGRRSELLKRGYARIPDADIVSVYPEEEIVELLGERGTIIIEDTKCWHKGAPVVEGNRLMFQLVFASSLFGGGYETHVLPQEEFSAGFSEEMQRTPRTYQRFKVSA